MIEEGIIDPTKVRTAFGKFIIGCRYNLNN